MYHFSKSDCPSCGGKKKVKTAIFNGQVSCKCYKCGVKSLFPLAFPVFRGKWVPPASP